jgi:hypothetical protein
MILLQNVPPNSPTNSVDDQIIFPTKTQKENRRKNYNRRIRRRHDRRKRTQTTPPHTAITTCRPQIECDPNPARTTTHAHEMTTHNAVNIIIIIVAWFSPVSHRHNMLTRVRMVTDFRRNDINNYCILPPTLTAHTHTNPTHVYRQLWCIICNGICCIISPQTTARWFTQPRHNTRFFDGCI